VKNYLKEGQWRYEWSWPQQQIHTESIADEIDQSIDERHLKMVSGPKRVMYSGRRKPGQSLGDYSDLEVNTKHSMICVKADGDSRGFKFWIAKVISIISRVGNIPNEIQIEWYIVDSSGTAMEGKYNPKKSKSRKHLQNLLKLSETTVFAYNFSLLVNKTLSVETRRIFSKALVLESNSE
jgi:hypothetical protein